MALSKDNFQIYFLLGLITVFGLLSFYIVLPYIFYIIGGIILVYINYPLYNRIHRTISNEMVASLLTIVLLLIVTIIPTLFLASTTVTQAQNVVQQLGTGLPTYIDTGAVEAQIQDITGQSVELDAMIQRATTDIQETFSSQLPGLIRTAVDVTIGLLLMTFTMYYLFKDGKAVLNRTKEMIPLHDDYKAELLQEADNMSEAILIGHLLTSTVQGIIAGLGLWAVGIPNVIFWTFIMIILGLIPLIGNIMVWGPAGLYLIFIQNEVVAGLALLLYGMTVVGFTDNLVRAKFVESRANIHPLLVLIGVIGGLPVFGLLGVVIGPLVLGFFVVLLRTYNPDLWDE